MGSSVVQFKEDVCIVMSTGFRLLNSTTNVTVCAESRGG